MSFILLQFVFSTNSSSSFDNPDLNSSLRRESANCLLFGREGFPQQNRAELSIVVGFFRRGVSTTSSSRALDCDGLFGRGVATTISSKTLDIVRVSDRVYYQHNLRKNSRLWLDQKKGLAGHPRHHLFFE